MSATLAGGELWAGAIEAAAGKSPAAAASPGGQSQLKWRSPKLGRTARKSERREAPTADETKTNETAQQSSLELRSATGGAVAEIKASLPNDFDDSSATIILTTAEEPIVDPFDDPFEDRKPKQPKPSELKLFPVIRAAQLRPIDVDDEELSAPPVELDAFEQAPAEKLPPDEMPADEPPQDEFPPARSQRDGDAMLPGEDEFAQNPPIEAQECPTPRDLKPIREITNRIAAEPGLFPQECSLGDEPFQPRQFARTTFTWRASALCHKPLYFEQPGVERYGHTFGPFLQPVIGTGHFFTSVIMLPYKMGMEPPWECVYPLGVYRPGSCAPYTIGPVPISVRGIATQAVGTLGFVYVFAQ